MHQLFKVTLLTLTLLLTSCVSSYHVDDLAQESAGSPYITKIIENNFSPRTPANKIQLYYKHWGPLTRPNAVENWEQIFVMGDSSSPKWKYLELSHVVVAQLHKDDIKAINELRNLANRQGGDGITNLHREPMIDSPEFGAKIIGFRYIGTVVRKM